jgi:hypothetical protein
VAFVTALSAREVGFYDKELFGIAISDKRAMQQREQLEAALTEKMKLA